MLTNASYEVQLSIVTPVMFTILFPSAERTADSIPCKLLKLELVSYNSDCDDRLKKPVTRSGLVLMFGLRLPVN